MATKQAQKQDTITDQQSKTLIKNMIRISVSSICYHRDIFPPECFIFKPYGNMEIVQLDAANVGDKGDIVVKDPKAFILTQWLEKGVFKVLEDNYLASMTFAVYSKHPLTQNDLLLEAYEFKFTYSDGRAQINGVAVKSKEDIKNQAGKFVRNLVLFASSLDELPQDNWITIEIKYEDTLPDDYEPEYFKTMDKSSLSFLGDSLRVKLGKIETPHLSTEAKFVGLESLLHENLCKIGQSSAPLTTSPDSGNRSIFHASHSKKESRAEDIPKDQQVSNQMESLSMNDIEVDREYQEKLNKVRSFILGSGKCVLCDIVGQCNVDSDTARNIMNDLANENILVRQPMAKRGFKFKVNLEYLRDYVESQSVPVVKPEQIPAQPLTPQQKKKPPVTVIEDIEEVPETQPAFASTSQASRSAVSKAPITYSSKASKVQSNSKAKIDSEYSSSYPPNKSIIVPESQQIQLSQASDLSQSSTTSRGKKRVYGLIKEPIEINRKWNKKPTLNKVVSQT